MRFQVMRFIMVLVLVVAVVYVTLDAMTRNTSDVREAALYPNCAKNVDIGYWSLSRGESVESGIIRMTDAEYQEYCEK